ASLTILFVFSPRFGASENAGRGENDRSFWQRQLEQIRPIDTTIPVQHVILEGDPATEIVLHAKEAGIDLIVMGTHGRTGLERFLIGSVAEKVMRDAPCSVLVVKLPRGIPVAEKSGAKFALNPI
ncbi:MAG TPA: universal stress protein, partial [Gemmataceae bacterium]|nr:universal stress protein [Gemmataceae bacterium]